METKGQFTWPVIRVGQTAVQPFPGLYQLRGFEQSISTLLFTNSRDNFPHSDHQVHKRSKYCFWSLLNNNQHQRHRNKCIVYFCQHLLFRHKKTSLRVHTLCITVKHTVARHTLYIHVRRSVFVCFKILTLKGKHEKKGLLRTPLSVLNITNDCFRHLNVMSNLVFYSTCTVSINAQVTYWLPISNVFDNTAWIPRYCIPCS